MSTLRKGGGKWGETVEGAGPREQEIKSLTTIFNSSLWWLSVIRWGVEKEMPQKSSMFLFLNCESAVISTTGKGAFLSFLVSRNMNHRLTHGLWYQHMSGTSDHPYQHGPMPLHELGIPSKTSTWPQVVDSVGHMHQYGLWWQHSQQISPWL